ncbi:ABC transporter permease [Anoxybacteroides tepidamans]|uniref:ABC transporter permease n=1 Tax=Anoxybacteroides tepidamans TaxID=265948 RepID=UPI000489D75B|nr:ABC transporter permease [Anoxybacillus tepidamans]
MIDSRLLWNQRFVRYIREMRRYLRYILNPHLLYVLLIAVGAGAFVYQRWVKALPPYFPYAIVGAVILSLLLTYSPVRTFFQEPDLVFLLPAEKQLRPYIQRSFLFSMAVHAYILIVALLVIAPLHLKFSTLPLWQLWAMLLLVKTWNMFISWKEHYFAESGIHYLGTMARLLINGAWVYFVLTAASLLFLLSLIIMMVVLSLYFVRATKRKGMAWERVIQQEDRAKLAFYRLANAFTDVPHLKKRAKRRRWLDGLLAFISPKQENTFYYLYVRTFLRAGDYFGLYARLTVIACFFLYIIPASYGQVITALFFLYATGFQLLVLPLHHRSNIFMKIYPLPDGLKKKAVLHLFFILLLVQNTFFASFLAVIGDWKVGLLLLAAGSLFSYLLVFMYLNRRWRER